MAKSDIHHFHEFIQIMEPFDVDADKNYSTLWFEMEIVYALILDEWESSGKKLELEEIFSGKYLKDVCEVVDEFTKYAMSGN